MVNESAEWRESGSTHCSTLMEVAGSSQTLEYISYHIILFSLGSLFYTDDGGSKLLRSIDACLPHNTSSHLGRLVMLILKWQPKISKEYYRPFCITRFCSVHILVSTHPISYYLSFRPQFLHFSRFTDSTATTHLRQLRS
jgi:hypothetical protein